MNNEVIDSMHHKLKTQVNRLNSANYKYFHAELLQFWSFLKSHPFFGAVLEHLESLSRPAITSEVNEFFSKLGKNPEPLIYDNHTERVISSYLLCKKCAELGFAEHLAEFRIGFVFCRRGEEESVDVFKTRILEPLWSYLEEQIDDGGIALALLRRYKQKCEWFERNPVYQLATSDTKQGERSLQFHLFNYLHDQGLNFWIEPASASGEIDLIVDQQGDNRLLADTKVFTGDTGYIVKGFAQIYQYTLDYNEGFGYLVIFKTCENGIDFDLDRSLSAGSIPCLSHNNKTIFLLVIDVFPYDKPASKRGQLKTKKISKDDLIKSL